LFSHAWMADCFYVLLGNQPPDDRPHENLELWNAKTGEQVHQWVQRKQFDWSVNLYEIQIIFPSFVLRTCNGFRLSILVFKVQFI
jgi:hypothetical protein